MSNTIRTVTSVAVSTVVAVGLLEMGSFAITEMKGWPNARPFKSWTAPKNCELDGVDSMFGYAPGRCETPEGMFLEDGLAFYQDETVRDPAPTILTLGGSTTDPVTMSKRDDIGFDTWPRLLADTCRASHPGCRVVNGGRAAFTSSQELLMLVRDGLALRPDVVVSLNGINEFYAFKDGVLRDHPFITRQQRELMKEACRSHGLGDVLVESGYLPNTLALVHATQYKLATMAADAGVVVPAEAPKGNLGCEPNLGLTHEGDTDPVAVWRSNVLAMHATAASMGAQYFVFLQPTLGVGGYAPTDDNDKALLEEAHSVRGNYGEYMPTIRKLYGGLRQACADLDFCFDVSELFVGQSEVYSDARHPNRKGNALQAAAIWPYVRSAIEPAIASAE